MPKRLQIALLFDELIFKNFEKKNYFITLIFNLAGM